jgi:hypothetical protein
VTHQEAVDSLASERYLLDDMSVQDRQAFEEHFFTCEVCADDLRTAAAMLQGAKAGFAGPSASADVVPFSRKANVRSARGWYRSIALPWAAAATLAGVAAYQSLWVIPSLSRATTPLALVPVTLHAASRGAEAVVPFPPGTQAVSLVLEINDPPRGGEISYDLSSSDEHHIVSGRAAAPPAGNPLLLVLPSWTLVGPMHYILSVRDAGSPARLLGEYRFALSTQ